MLRRSLSCDIALPSLQRYSAEFSAQRMYKSIEVLKVRDQLMVRLKGNCRYSAPRRGSRRHTRFKVVQDSVEVARVSRFHFKDRISRGEQMSGFHRW